MSDKPRFVADVMLGSLAKWLRIMGFNTLYFRVIDDNELVKIAKQEDRILLTRDLGISSSKKAGQCILIRSQDTMEQLREVLKSLGSQPYKVISPQRCASCNGELLPAERSAIFGEVPEYVFWNSGDFLKCGDCGKVYWDGSHKIVIDAVIAAINKDMEAC
jgi:uncharacterized protein with PIN domain